MLYVRVIFCFTYVARIKVLDYFIYEKSIILLKNLLIRFHLVIRKLFAILHEKGYR